MPSNLPRLVLARHGDTDWTDSRRKTGRTDLPLNGRGERRARLLGERLQQFTFAHVLTSPLQRASRTCALAGFGNVAELQSDLVEWDYGRFEGKTTADIQQDRPDWELFRDGCPGGESALDVAQRADRFIARVYDSHGDVLAFSSGHIIRMIAARWLRLPPCAGRIFYCEPASFSVLEFEHDNKNEPIIGLWNFVRQLNEPPFKIGEDNVHARSRPIICSSDRR
jgi:broad specificity phosphatase PhoE